KFLPTYLNSGPMEGTTSTQAATISLRCAMLQTSILVWYLSRNRKMNDSLEECWPGPFDFGALTKRDVSIGVRVKDTSSETAMAKALVKPKELMNRPTMPPMNP